jgi:two-component system NtrC family sensor kinase
VDVPSTPIDSQIQALGRLVDRSAQPCLVVDLKGRLVRGNKAFEDLLGYSSEELIRLDVSTITPLRWHELSERVLARVLETGHAVRYEKEYECKDGRVIEVEVAVDLDHDDVGQPRGFFAFVTDISERIKAEHLQHEQARLYRAIFDHAFQFIGLLEADGTLLEANRTALEFAGVTREEVVGRPFWEGPWWKDSPAMRDRLIEAIAAGAQGQLSRFETTHLSHDGREIIVDFSLKPVFDETGKVVLLIPEGRDITENKRAEEAIRASEERFRHLYDEAPVGYHEIDRNGVIVSINKTECEMLGYSREEMVGRPITAFVAPEQREQSKIAVREKIAGIRALCPLERTFVTRDGRMLVLAIDERYRLDETGSVIGIRTAVQDVTERKRTEAALVASERRNRALFEGIEDAVFVHDVDGKILDANPAACRKLGYSREELLNLHTRDVDDPDFATGYEDRLRRQIERGHLSFEGRHRTKNGQLIPVEINTSTILFEDQRAVLAVIRDITDRQALEETRRRFAESQIRAAEMIEAKNRELVGSEARYRQLTEGTHDAVVVADETGLITLFNPAAERTFGYRAEEVMGKPLTLLMPEESRSGHDAGFRRFNQTRQSKIVGQTIELQGLRKSGDRFPLELSLSAFESEGRLQFIGSIRDQTERQRMRAMLVQSEKLASIGLLSAGVAHEINNPLAYVANNLAVLDRDLKGVVSMVATYEASRDSLIKSCPELVAKVDEISEELDWPYVRQNLERLISRTRDGVQRVATIVQNLRGLARTSPPKLEPGVLREIIGPAVEMIQGRGKRKNIEVLVEDAPPIRLNCVTSQISQVVLNLLVNSLQAVETANRPQGGRIVVSPSLRDDMAVITIKDNGCGIHKDHLPHLFDPFFTTKTVGEGTGLGLSISHGIITGHGGRIEVESEPDVGTTFTIFLPRNATQVAEPTYERSDNAAGPLPEKG